MRAIKGGLSARGRARGAGKGGAGVGAGETLVALFLWLNNGREEMLTMADRENHVEVKRAVLESLVHVCTNRTSFPWNMQLIVFKRSGNITFTFESNSRTPIQS